MNGRKGQYCKHAIHCLNLVYHRRFFSPRRCNTDSRGMLFNMYHHCPLLTFPGRVIWSPSNNSKTGSSTPGLRLLSSANLLATSRIFPSVMHWTQLLRYVPTESATSAKVPVSCTMVDRAALTPLVPHACLLPATSTTAIYLFAMGIAASTLPLPMTVEATDRASKIISVPLPALFPFGSRSTA